MLYWTAVALLLHIVKCREYKIEPNCVRQIRKWWKRARTTKSCVYDDPLHPKALVHSTMSQQHHATTQQKTATSNGCWQSSEINAREREREREIVWKQKLQQLWQIRNPIRYIPSARREVIHESVNSHSGTRADAILDRKAAGYENQKPVNKDMEGLHRHFQHTYRASSWTVLHNWLPFGPRTRMLSCTAFTSAPERFTSSSSCSCTAWRDWSYNVLSENNAWFFSTEVQNANWRNTWSAFTVKNQLD